MTAASTQGFTPPSPGAWELEQTHLTKPPSRLIGELLPEPMMRGFSEGTRYYGLLLDYLEVVVINRFLYTAPRPVGAPKSAKGAPPRYAILVRDGDAKAALAAVTDLVAPHEDAADVHAVETHFDPEKGYVQCPACGASPPTGATECPECGLGLGGEEAAEEPPE